MNHIVFATYDGPDNFEGPTVNAARLLPQLRKRGHRVTALLVTDSPITTHQTTLEDAGVDCRIVPRRGYTEDLTRSAVRLLKTLQPSVFVPNVWIPGCFAARWLRESGVPSVAAYRSDDALYDGIVSQFVLGDPLWAVSGMVCVSREFEARIQRHHPQRTQTIVIPSGVRLPKRTRKCRGPLKIVYVGRITQEQKRILDVGRAVISVLRKTPGAEATFYGQGNDMQSLRKMIHESGMVRRINLAGPVAQNEIQERLIEYDVMVLLSDYEGTPGALMDAMACGVVPVVLDIPGGVQELVIDGETGFLVEDRTGAFVDAVRLLDRDVSLREAMGRRARNHIEARFSLERTVSLWENFIEDLRGAAGTRTPVESGRIRFPQPQPSLLPHMHNKPTLLLRVHDAAKRAISRWYSPNSREG